VRPTGLLLASIVVTTVTPDAKRLKADRNNSSETGIQRDRENMDAAVRCNARQIHCNKFPDIPKAGLVMSFLAGDGSVNGSSTCKDSKC